MFDFQDPFFVGCLYVPTRTYKNGKVKIFTLIDDYNFSIPYSENRRYKRTLIPGLGVSGS